MQDFLNLIRERAGFTHVSLTRVMCCSLTCNETAVKTIIQLNKAQYSGLPFGHSCCKMHVLLYRLHKDQSSTLPHLAYCYLLWPSRQRVDWQEVVNSAPD